MLTFKYKFAINKSIVLNNQEKKQRVPSLFKKMKKMISIIEHLSIKFSSIRP